MPDTYIVPSQYFSDKQYRQIGVIAWQAIWVAVLATPLALSILPLANWICPLLDHDASLIDQELTYLRGLAWGTPAFLLSSAMSSYFSGQQRTWVVLFVDATSTLVNIGLDYLLIFGFTIGIWKVEPQGIWGAAIATSAAYWIRVMIYVYLMSRVMAVIPKQQANNVPPSRSMPPPFYR